MQGRGDTNVLGLFGSFALGAGLMYGLDPVRGRRRRAVTKDKLFSALHELEDAAGKTSVDFWNRSRGLVANARGAFSHDEPSDEVVCARVRAKMGRMVSHPHAIRVDARDGNLTLRGPILQHELHDLLRAVGRVAGVRHLDCQLEVHKQPGDIAALQGGRQRPGDRFELMQENWAPATRLLMGSLGAGIGFYGFARRDIWGAFIGLFGASLLVRAASNLETSRLTGVGSGRRGIDIQKTININTSPHDVFDFWRNYDNFPLFMHNVREVKDLGNGRSRWRIAGPAGTPVEFNSIVTAYIPNELIAWKSEPGSIIRSAGIVRFDRNTDGSTRVNIQMTYNPVAGAVGHALASLFGADPKSEMDADMARLKTLIETGNFPHDAAKSPAEMI